MADNYLERHMRDYEERKARWLNRKKHIKKHIKSTPQGRIGRPEDEAL